MTCQICGASLTGRRSDAVTCSQRCRLRLLRQRKADADGMPVRWPWRLRPDRETGAMQTNAHDPYWSSWPRKYPDR